MTIKQVDADASGDIAEAGGAGPTHELWVAPRLASAPTDQPWQEVTPSGTVLRRQFVFLPSPDPWKSISHAREALDGGAPRVIRLRPGALGHRFPLVDWVLEPLPAVCERDGYALSLDYGPRGAIPLDELATFGCSAPEVPLLLLGDRLCEHPAIWRLLDRCPNVILQLTSRAGAQDVATAVTTFGHHRFAFGSRGVGRELDDDVLGLLDDDARRAVVGETAQQLDSLTWRERWL